MNLQRLTRLLLVLLLLCSHHTLLLAQSRTLSGKVINQETKEPMRGVSVNIKGSTKGTVTNEQGAFSLSGAPDSGAVTLVFSYIGFDTKEMKATLSGPLSVEMQNSNKKLDDVVVIGYGTQKRSNILGSVSTVNPKEVEDLPVANLSTALVNLAPGVGISQTSGKPGATTTVSIRGAYTFAAGGTTSPLYIIDGLAPIIGTGSGVDPTGKTAFDNLDPSQVESITFLKDASATIYGARGANGVVIVTTKKGRPGKPRLSYSGSYSTEDATKIPHVLSGYDQASLLNNWVQNYKQNNVVTSELYTSAELDTIKSHDYNWLKSEWKPASIQRHTINVSGGTEKLTYFTGVNYYNEIGNIPLVVANKYGIQLGMTAKIVEGLSTELSVNYNTSYSNRPAPKGTTVTEQTDQLNATVGGLLTVPRFVPEYINGNPVYYAPLNWHPGALANSNSYSKDNANNFALNASMEYKIPVIKGLSLRAQYGRNTLSDNGKQYYPSYNTYQYTLLGAHTNNASGVNKATGTQGVIYNPLSPVAKLIKNGDQLQNINTASNNWQATEGISYAREFGDHSVSASVFAEQEQTTGNYVIATNSTQVIPGVDQIFGFSNDGSNIILSGQPLSTGRVSYLGRLDYSFKGRYLLEGAFRDDASPNFPTEHQWGFFPSGSVGWKVSEERFFEENVHFLNDLKIRFNMGLTGNDATSAFSWVQRYSSNNGYLFGGTYTNGLTTAQVPNPEITWERALFKDLGIDGTFANRKFNFTIDYFYKHGYDMLDQPTATVPNTFGTTIANENYSILNSWGWEGHLGYHQNLSKDWQVFASVNLGFGNNKVIRKYYSVGTDTAYKYPIGKRTDLGIAGYKATGIVRSQQDVNAFYAKHPGWLINGDSLRPGDLNYQDLDGDGVITSNDQTQIAKRSSTIFGAGFNIGAQWKGLRVSTNVSLGLGGQTAWKKVDITPPTKDVNGLSMWRNSYTAANVNAPMPAIYSPLVNQVSTFWLHSATYMYVNNMQVSYQVPVSFTAHHHLPEIRAYLTGSNLWTIINPTPYRDPRSNEITDYPILRTWTFGLNLNL